MEKVVAPRFGIGEWYGRLATALTVEEIEFFSSEELNDYSNKSKNKIKIECPFKQSEDVEKRYCHKKGGVCSLRLYEKGDNGSAVVHTGRGSALRVVCPSRFEENKVIQKWIGGVVLGSDDPLFVTEVGFLKGVSFNEHNEKSKGPDDVGRIDLILIHPEKQDFWCAVEVQAVYFSGKNMKKEFKNISNFAEYGLPFPEDNRRPDYRSSAPKRLMPQLQIKVPTLRRWGKKMCVVVDEAFFDKLRIRDTVNDSSNADIIWFAASFEINENQAVIRVGKVHYTTLESAVDGLTAGLPLTLEEFEANIYKKMVRNITNTEKSIKKRKLK